MKKAGLFLLAIITPFLLVWIAFICTAGAFSPQMVFNSGQFWGMSIIYWVIFCPIITIAIFDN
jgi:hypothetical protein